MYQPKVALASGFKSQLPIISNIVAGLKAIQYFSYDIINYIIIIINFNYENLFYIL